MEECLKIARDVMDMGRLDTSNAVIVIIPMTVKDICSVLTATMRLGAKRAMDGFTVTVERRWTSRTQTAIIASIRAITGGRNRGHVQSVMETEMKNSIAGTALMERYIAAIVMALALSDCEWTYVDIDSYLNHLIL